MAIKYFDLLRITIVCMVFFCPVINVQAQEEDEGSFIIDNLHYQISSYEKKTVELYRNSIIQPVCVDVPSHVTYKGEDYAVTEIGSDAFSGCDLLESINIPNTVVKIWGTAFRGCSRLRSAFIPESVTEIGKEAFLMCDSLVSIDLQCKIDVIEIGVFQQCESLKTITIPNTVTIIKEHAFHGCSSLTNIELSNSLIEIERQAFQWCTSLESMVIPNSVEAIGSLAFDRCFSLKDVVLSESLKEVDLSSFSSCGLTSIDIPSSVKTIGNYAFEYCDELTSVYIPNSVESIGVSAFQGCGLKSVTLPNAIETIESMTFYGCGDLNSIVIPTSVKSISGFAMANCSSLEKMFVKASTPPSINLNTFSFENVPDTTIVYVPIGSRLQYMETSGWNYFKDIREMAVVDIILPPSLDLEVGESKVLSPQITFGEGTSKVSEVWMSSNPNVAIVSEDGEVTAVSEGTTAIVYQLKDNYGCISQESCMVKVNDNSGVKSFKSDNLNNSIEYYNINGVRVDSGNLRPGIYIKLEGNKTKKILIK